MTAEFHDTGLAVVRVRGADAARFLHAQFTNDVEAMQAGDVALGAWCTAQGKVRHLFWTVADEDGFDLLCPADAAGEFGAELRRFVLRAKVEVTGDGGERVFGIGGDALAAAGLPAPEEGRALVSGDGRVCRVPGATARYLVYGAGADGGDADAWRRLDIEAGIAWPVEATRESFIPQMLNLDRLGAVSFSKGCYPGQEIVARTRYLGRLKRRLYRARVAAGQQSGPAPGDAVQQEDGRTAGTVVAVAPADAESAVELLAVLPLELPESALTLADGRALEGVAVAHAASPDEQDPRDKDERASGAARASA